jgi:hypothetical protein
LLLWELQLGQPTAKGQINERMLYSYIANLDMLPAKGVGLKMFAPVLTVIPDLEEQICTQ